MGKYKFLFLDLDDTILDFQWAEHHAIRTTLASFGIDPTDAVCSRYSHINKLHWQMLERGELTREQVLTGRFAALFRELGVEADAAVCAKRYEVNLGTGHRFLPGAEEAMQTLSEKYRLFLASNGTASVQKGRMTSANLYRFFERSFVSQDIGAVKPEAAYFNRCFAQIPGFCKEQAIMVGDSLSSDIRGGINAGIATCWVNPKGLPYPPDCRPDYIIESLDQLPELLETI